MSSYYHGKNFLDVYSSLLYGSRDLGIIPSLFLTRSRHAQIITPIILHKFLKNELGYQIICSVCVLYT